MSKVEACGRQPLAGHRRSVYPGSFDPLTNGHLDIVRRATKIFDGVLIAVQADAERARVFTVEERIELIRRCTEDAPAIEVHSFTGLLVDFMRKAQATVIVRGIRAVSDYERELQMAHMNRQLQEGAETIFMPAAIEYTFVSSRLVYDVFRRGGDVARFVPAPVLDALRTR